DLKVDLEPSALNAAAHLLAPGPYAAPGVVALNAQITGLAPRLVITGELHLESASQGPQRPVSIHLHAANLLSSPQWEAAAEFNQAPLAAFLDAARRA